MKGTYPFLLACMTVFLVGTAAECVPAATDCASDCLMKFVDLRDSYSTDEVVTIKVRNDSTREFGVNVAVEAMTDGHWAERLMSVTDPQHPYGKAVRLTQIRPGESLAVTYAPVEGGKEGKAADLPQLPLMLRFRADVHDVSRGGTLVERVRSREFRIAPKSR